MARLFPATRRGAALLLVIGACGRVDYDPVGADAGLACVRAFSAQGGGACAVRPAGSVWCWGQNTGSSIASESGAPIVVDTAPPTASVHAAEYHTCLTAVDGSVWCWGANDAGQIGDGTTAPRPTPTRAAGLVSAVEVATGQFHSCARDSAGAIFCWGDNAAGELGDATTTARFTPNRVPGAVALAIAVGDRVTFALLGDQTLLSWGADDPDGALGDGLADPYRSSPAPVVGLAGVVEVSAGCHRHACAVLADESLWCWGSNDFGQLGDGTITPMRDVPVRALLDGVAEVSAGAFHTCARTLDGIVSCWGSNDLGQLGDQTIGMRSVPAVVPLAAATNIEAGCDFSCAHLADGSIWCWGNDAGGALGDGTTIGGPAAVRVEMGELCR